MKKLFVSVFCLVMLFGLNANDSSISADELSDDEFLLETGMSQNEIDSLDEDIKEYMVNDMKENADLSSLEYIESEVTGDVTPMVEQNLTGITFDVSSYKSGDTIYIYPTYQFTDDKKPKGQDSFSVQLGDAMESYQYGGELWYKDYTMDDWERNSSLQANKQEFNGAEFSGAQLGTPDLSMQMKGATHVHAKSSENGSDKRIIMSYMHNPSKYSYDIEFSVGGVAINYNSLDTIYTAAKTVHLDY